MGNHNRHRRTKTLEYRLNELSGELSMLHSDIQNFQGTRQKYWINSIAGRLHKLLVIRNQNVPLLIDLAKKISYSLIVYVSVMVPEMRSYSKKIPKPIFSIAFQPISLIPDEVHRHAIPLEEAIELPHILHKGQFISYKNILIEMRDTESAHSDLERPELLFIVDEIENSGLTGSEMAIYELAKLTLVIGEEFVGSINLLDFELKRTIP